MLRITAGALLVSVFLPAAAALVALRAWSPDSSRLTVLLAVLPWALPWTVAALVGALLVGVRQRWGAALAAAALLLLVPQVAWQLPAYVGGHAIGPADLTVLELNLRYGSADPRATVDLVRHSGADLVVLAEIDDRALAALDARGLDRLLPHRAGSTGSGRHGLMVFSRYPLRDARQLPGATAVFRVHVGAPAPFALVAVHAAQPALRAPQWARDQAAVLRAVRATAGPQVVAGDLNGTVDQGPVRALLDSGLRDAAQAADSGWQPTWPGAVSPWGRPHLGVLTIDHVLVGRGFGVVATRTHLVPGTDHRALVAALTLP